MSPKYTSELVRMYETKTKKKLSLVEYIIIGHMSVEC